MQTFVGRNGVPPPPCYSDRLQRRRPLALPAFCSETTMVSAQRSPRPEALRCSVQWERANFPGQESPDADFQASSSTPAGPVQGHLAGRSPDGLALRASLPRTGGGAHCLVLRSPRSLPGHRSVGGTPLPPRPPRTVSSRSRGCAHGRGQPKPTQTGKVPSLWRAWAGWEGDRRPLAR